MDKDYPFHCKGNIFSSTLRTLVCPVNCVGVMGAGLALQFKKAFPRLDNRYKLLVKDGLLKIGYTVLITSGVPRWSNNVLMFPTKQHWKGDSKLTWIVDGMKHFYRNWKRWRIQSIAFPLLGAGLGKLDDSKVYEIIEHYLKKIPIPTEIWVYNNAE